MRWLIGINCFLLFIACLYKGFLCFIDAGIDDENATFVKRPDDKHYVFHIDDKFNEDEIFLIQKALNSVELVCPCVKLTFVVEPVSFLKALSWRSDQTYSIYKADNKLRWTYYTAKRLLDDDGPKLGVTILMSGDIFVFFGVNKNDSQDDKDIFKYTIIHEVIHALLISGWHSDNPQSIMYHVIGGRLFDQKLLEEEKNKLEKICNE